jgi:3-deoxy-D-manno-octulosonic-acid transferase
MAVPAGRLVLMPRWLYSLLLRLALPFAALMFLWRGWRSPAYRGSLRQRLGLSLPRRTDRPLWLHAASVGEVRALSVLARTLHSQGSALLVTVGTPVGLARAREIFADLQVSTGSAFAVQAAPWDLPGAARRFLEATRPRAAVFVETELWPNLVAAARQSGIRPVLVSARLSARSQGRYLRFAPQLMRDTVRAFAAIGAQTDVDRARFIGLGAEPASVSVIGNLKFDLAVDAAIPARGAVLRAHWAQGRPLWVAGSTHPGEEADCIAAQGELLRRARAAGRASPLLALAPRRPERFAAVAQWLGAQGMQVARASQGAAASADVVLIDAMGVLMDWYAAADIAFVGGSLVSVGGHNLLEPAALGRPVIAGSNQFNAPDVAAKLSEAGGLLVVADQHELANSVDALLENASLAKQRGAQAAAAVAANRGAAMRARAMIAEVEGAAAREPAAVPASG